jgi:hypothetical protein
MTSDAAAMSAGKGSDETSFVVENRFRRRGRLQHSTSAALVTVQPTRRMLYLMDVIANLRS